MVHALSIPEIQWLIGSLLSHHDRKSCALVSQSWAASMIPWIWQSVSLRCADSPEKLATIHKHRSFVRKLRIDLNEMPASTYDWFDKLQVLQICYQNSPKKSMRHMAALVRRNMSSLQSIHDATQYGWETLVVEPSLECPSLKSLSYSYFNVQEKTLMETLIKTCTRLTTLSLGTINFTRWSPLLLQGQEFTHLERVRMSGFSSKIYLDLLRACPNLKALTIFLFDTATVEDLLRVVTVHCKQLSALCYDRRELGGSSDLEKLAWALPLVKYLQRGIIHSRIEDVTLPSFFILSKHFEALQAINLPSFQNLGNAVVKTILYSCPNLRSFVPGSVDIKDIQSESPWACQKLQRLEIHFRFRSDEQHLFSAVYKQLSELTQLRVLNFDQLWSPLTPIRQPLRLGQGLESLASLKRLEYFGVEALEANWRAEEIEWIIQTWPNILSVYNSRSMGEEIYTRLCERIGMSSGSSHFDHMDFVEFGP